MVEPSGSINARNVASAVLSTQRDQSGRGLRSVAQTVCTLKTALDFKRVMNDHLGRQIIEKSEIVEARSKIHTFSAFTIPKAGPSKPVSWANASLVYQICSGQTRGQVDHRADLACQCPLGCVFQAFSCETRLPGPNHPPHRCAGSSLSTDNHSGSGRWRPCQRFRNSGSKLNNTF